MKEDSYLPVKHRNQDGKTKRDPSRPFRFPSSTSAEKVPWSNGGGDGEGERDLVGDGAWYEEDGLGGESHGWRREEENEKVSDASFREKEESETMDVPPNMEAAKVTISQLHHSLATIPIPLRPRTATVPRSLKAFLQFKPGQAALSDQRRP